MLLDQTLSFLAAKGGQEIGWNVFAGLVRHLQLNT